MPYFLTSQYKTIIDTKEEERLKAAEEFGKKIEEAPKTTGVYKSVWLKEKVV